MKPKLLVVELWGLGDLVIATPFLQAASSRYEVTLIAKPYAKDLRTRFWPEIEVYSFVAPWTAFHHKYRLWSWPWKSVLNLRHLGSRQFDVGLSGRWDPRDHLLLASVGVRRRFGFPRLRSQMFLTDPLERPAPISHRYENWRVLAKALDLPLPGREHLSFPQVSRNKHVLVHTGAGQPVRVWPLPHYRDLVRRLRHAGYVVQVASDPDQRDWWQQQNEPNHCTPKSVSELLTLIDRAGAFIGNDSGPSHLAAFCGVPTFTLFGPQLPEWFAPLHPLGECLEGKPCPYKPCSDYCRFPLPYCMSRTTEEEVWEKLSLFLARVIPKTEAATPGR